MAGGRSRELARHGGDGASGGWEDRYGASWQVGAPVRDGYTLTVYYRPDANLWGGWTADDLSDGGFAVVTP